MSTVLIVANQTLDAAPLRYVESRLSDDAATEFKLLVPVIHRMHESRPAASFGNVPQMVLMHEASLDEEEAADYAAARARLDLGLDLFRRLGANVDGSV